jgi:hypothetical protein
MRGKAPTLATFVCFYPIIILETKMKAISNNQAPQEVKGSTDKANNDKFFENPFNRLSPAGQFSQTFNQENLINRGKALRLRAIDKLEGQPSYSDPNLELGELTPDNQVLRGSLGHKENSQLEQETLLNPELSRPDETLYAFSNSEQAGLAAQESIIASNESLEGPYSSQTPSSAGDDFDASPLDEGKE